MTNADLIQSVSEATRAANNQQMLLQKNIIRRPKKVSILKKNKFNSTQNVERTPNAHAMQTESSQSRIRSLHHTPEFPRTAIAGRRQEAFFLSNTSKVDLNLQMQNGLPQLPQSLAEQ